MGVFGLQTLVGKHRDLNPRPPACESGVVAIALRGPPQILALFAFFKVNLAPFLPPGLPPVHRAAQVQPGRPGLVPAPALGGAAGVCLRAGGRPGGQGDHGRRRRGGAGGGAEEEEEDGGGGAAQAQGRRRRGGGGGKGLHNGELLLPSKLSEESSPMRAAFQIIL